MTVKFQHLVLDSGPIILNTVPTTLSEHLYTTPEVLAELKDVATRDRLVLYPNLVVRNPSMEALQTVREFAKMTGDVVSLSGTDLKVVALTLTLEWEMNGVASARTRPVDLKIHESQSMEKKTSIGSSKLSKVSTAAVAATSGEEVSMPEDKVSLPKEEASVSKGKESLPNSVQEKESLSNSVQEKESLSNSVQEKESLSNSVQEKAALPASESESKSKSKKTSGPTPDSNPVEEEEWDGDWITPDNIAMVKAKASKTLSSPAAGTVGCMSTDFAVQNVLLQMRLKVYGPEGYRIRQVKSWLLRCHACYSITRQLERRFCDKCGGATLLRTSYMVDAQGQTHLFLKRDFQYNLRGTKTPLPMPKAGRGGNTVLLREDQKEYQQAMKSYQRQEKRAAKMTDLDAIDDRLATVFGGMTFKGAAKLEMPFLPVIGFGRKNPNQARRRV
ncbi:hypothetical protein PSACC_01787 [Paramicrosporidium saccamoebae]|uniref:20S-pre-rRNA D-site endonuclease NOB1 n=1 Tax=Paramicrosporidium saccamoebae TaxID=1246581 RepID=A0A2H9TKV4_9FUNG|nr:hypothetical protein PSACC_01787 [Paramicrosporidium saccamoebae]